MEPFQITRIWQNSYHLKRALLVFPHWGGESGPYQRFAQYFTKWQSVIYQCPDSLLTSDLAATLENFQALERAALKDVRRLQSFGVKQFTIYGVSLGTAIATRVADILAASGLDVLPIINGSGASFPFAVWNGRATREIRRQWDETGKTYQDVEAAWDEYSPINNLCHLHTSRILAFLSLRDEVIVPKNASRFAQELRTYRYAKVRLNRFFGHHKSIVKNSLRILVARNALSP